MTIKDVELFTGMTRANIRFYESEGLIIPARNVNGYREYTEFDVDELNKIKLLRNLQVSLEDIKKIKIGEYSLDAFMEIHMQKIAEQEETLKKSRDVCQRIQKECATFSELNAMKYLQLLETGIHEQDVLEKDPMIWRRFFARTLDFTIYGVIWFSFISIVANRSISVLVNDGVIWHTLIIFIITLLIEPVLISRIGTTLGKWILGLYVFDYDDMKLDYSSAVERTFKVLLYGYGFNIPIYNWVRLFKNFKLLEVKQDLPWETDTVISLKKKKTIQFVLYGVAVLTAVGVISVVMNIGELPKHRGELTISEFKENYVKLCKYHDVQKPSFEEDNPYSNQISVFLEDSPEFSFIEEDGFLKCVSLELEYEGSEGEFISSCQNEMILSILALGNKNTGEIGNVISYISAHPYEGFVFDVDGYHIECVVDVYGYENVMDTFFAATAGEHSYYHMLFEIRK